MKKKFLLCFMLPGTILYAQSVCSPSTGSAYLNINNVNATILGGGDLWRNNNAQSAYYEVPKGSGHNTMYAGSLWLGGIDNNSGLHLAAQTYRQNGNDFWPGPITSSGTTDTSNCLLYDKVWKVNKSDITAHISNPSNPPLSISTWPAKGNEIAPGIIINEDMAPFVDVNSNGIYDPNSGDYPKINGDQAIWYIINDIGNVHSETGAQALGVEIHVMAYSYLTSDILNNTTFYEYNIKNKSTTSYHDFYIGFWTDCDLGSYLDDYFGCDSTRNAAIYYNSDSLDDIYGLQIPVTAVVGVQTPLENNVVVPMRKLGYYSNDAGNNGNPVTPEQYYNYLTGKWKDGTNWGYNYAYPGSPCLNNEISMIHPAAITPSDWRAIQSFGPMTFEPGQCKNITTAVVTTFNSVYPAPCFDPIRASIDSVKILHQSLAINSLSCQSIQGFKEIELGGSLNIFPNPATSSIFINTINAENSNYKIYTLDGRVVLSGLCTSNTTQIPIGDIREGLYMVVLFNNLGQTIGTGKVSIQ